MNPVSLTITIDLNSILALCLGLFLAFWFFSPVLINIPKKLGLDKKDSPIFLVTLGMGLALPWVLTAALISIVAVVIQHISSYFYSIASKMKTKIW